MPLAPGTKLGPYEITEPIRRRGPTLVRIVDELSATRRLSLRTPSSQSTVYSSSGLLATNLPLLSRRLQLSVPLRVDLLLT